MRGERNLFYPTLLCPWTALLMNDDDCEKQGKHVQKPFSFWFLSVFSKVFAQLYERTNRDPIPASILSPRFTAGTNPQLVSGPTL